MRQTRQIGPAKIARRGTILIYTTIGMIAFAGIVSLAVDVGHARLVKNQLQHAADAAARYAAAGMQTSTGAATSNAVAAAGNNTADATSVLVDPNNDVEFGSWDNTNHTFTVLTGSAQSGANAVRVTCRRTAARGNPVPLTFGPVIGRSTCDVTASAIATMSSQSHGVVGLNSVSMSGNTSMDSYSSANGPYSSGAAGSSASVASNGNISLSGGATIKGDANPGVGMQTSGNGVSGSTTPLASPLSYPPASAGSYATTNDDANVLPYMRNGGFSLSGSQSAVMPGGTYYFKFFRMSGGSQLILTGPVTIYVAGTVNLSGGVTTSSSIPENLKIEVTGSSNVTLTGSSAFYADVYAPQSNVTITGSAQVMGAVVGQSLSLSGSAAVHMDQGISGSGHGVSLVQ